MDSEPAEDHDRHRIGHVALDSTRRFRAHYGADRESIIADYFLTDANHIGSRSAALLILQCSPSQPLIERSLSAVEFPFRHSLRLPSLPRGPYTLRGLLDN